jgi:hypothetical protein
MHSLAGTDIMATPSVLTSIKQPASLDFLADLASAVSADASRRQTLPVNNIVRTGLVCALSGGSVP